MKGRSLPVLLAVAAFSALLHYSQPAQAQVIGAVKGVKFAPEFYPPPHETQVKTLLEAARMQTLGSNRFLLTEARLQSFKPTGEPELIVKTPECTYDSGRKQADSPGQLQVQSGDGKFTLEGEGFLWQQQTNASLIVSNRVHTVVQADVLAQDATPPTRETGSQNEPVDIHAHSFRYDAESGLGVYRDNVRVSGTNINGTSLALASGVLTLKLPMKERQLQQVTAEQEVSLDYGGVHATGDRAIYEMDQALVRVSGHPAWQSEGREGRGDEFLIDRKARILRANGNAWLKLPAENFGSKGFLQGSVTSKGDSLARPVRSATSLPGEGTLEVSCGAYEMRTNSATFNTDVKVAQKTGGSPGGQMTCDMMNVTFSGTNELQTLVAEKHVVIQDEAREFTAAKAIYTATNSLLALTGQPAWRAGLREGKADVLRFDLLQDEMLASGNASMKLPAEQLGATQMPGDPPVTAPGSEKPSDFAEIFSEDYTLRAERALFRGGVYITHPRMMWSCQTVEVNLPPEGAKGHEITAQQNVFFEVVDQTGQKVHGRGEKAVYTFSAVANKTNDVMRLTGNPVIETTNGTFRNSVIIFDRARNKVIAPGKYVIRGSSGALGKTFKMPPNRWIK